MAPTATDRDRELIADINLHLDHLRDALAAVAGAVANLCQPAADPDPLAPYRFASTGNVHCAEVPAHRVRAGDWVRSVHGDTGADWRYVEDIRRTDSQLGFVLAPDRLRWWDPDDPVLVAVRLRGHDTHPDPLMQGDHF